MAPYSTRLLVLGVVRIFEPAHGYLLLQELNSWKVDEWANVKPGSVYSALSTLSKDGLLEIVAATDDAGSAAKTSYRTTAAGVAEFERLVQVALTDVHSPSMATTMSSIGFLGFFERAQILRWLGERREPLAQQLNKHVEVIENFQELGPEAPPHVIEQFYFSKANVQANLEWTDGFISRLERGDYSFLGEEPTWTPPEDDPIWGKRR